MIPVLQCGKCKFGISLNWDVNEDDGKVGMLRCSQYPKKIPNYVEEATALCPKFEE